MDVTHLRALDVTRLHSKIGYTDLEDNTGRTRDIQIRLARLLLKCLNRTCERKSIKQLFRRSRAFSARAPC
jgi:hypothetical protein